MGECEMENLKNSPSEESGKIMYAKQNYIPILPYLSIRYKIFSIYATVADSIFICFLWEQSNSIQQFIFSRAV